MSRWPWVGKPAPGCTRSSLMTRTLRKPMWRGSRYSANEKVWRLESQPSSERPRSALGRTVIMGYPYPRRRVTQHCLSGRGSSSSFASGSPSAGEQGLPERRIDRLRSDPDREQHVREVLTLDHANFLPLGDHRCSSPREVGERQRVAGFDRREHRLEALQSILQTGCRIAGILLERAADGGCDLRSRERAQRME